MAIMSVWRKVKLRQTISFKHSFKRAWENSSSNIILEKYANAAYNFYMTLELDFYQKVRPPVIMRWLHQQGLNYLSHLREIGYRTPKETLEGNPRMYRHIHGNSWIPTNVHAYWYNPTALIWKDQIVYIPKRLNQTPIKMAAQSDWRAIEILRIRWKIIKTHLDF